MNILQFLLVFLSFGFIGVIYLNLNHAHGRGVIHTSGVDSNIYALTQLINAQNETIHALERHLKAKHKDLTVVSEEYTKLVEVSELIGKLSVPRLEKSDEKSNVTPIRCDSETKVAPNAHLTSMEKECESKYGMDLVKSWRRNREVWCTDDHSADGVQAELICYPYHQVHKQLDGRGPDLFCEATNFVIDFSKVKGDHGADHKPALGSQYLSFERGSISGACKTTSSFKSSLFMPHHSLQMRSFTSEVSAVDGSYETENTPTYLLARDEDCENSFHSTADFMNMFLVNSVLDMDVASSQVMLFDKHPDGPYLELIDKAFSPNHKVLRHQHYRGKKVMFKRLVFHLESPAGLIFPKVSRPDPLRCYDTSLFDAYRRYVLQAFNLMDVKPPEIPTVTLSLRHRTLQKNVGRVLANEEAVKDVLRKGNLINIHVEDTAKLSFYEQLKLIRSTNILIGVHGAGLMFIMFAAEEAVLIEIHPSYRQDRHFRHAARMTGKIYMPMRTMVRESCVGTSDSVTVPVEEFERVLDGAVRIARNFDDGLSECGLVCPYPILALDGRLDLHYKANEHKTNPVNTQFPCG